MLLICSLCPAHFFTNAIRFYCLPPSFGLVIMMMAMSTTEILTWVNGITYRKITFAERDRSHNQKPTGITPIHRHF